MNEQAAILVAEPTAKRDRPLMAVPLNADASPMQMIAIAVQQGADIDKIRQLMDLKDRYEAGEARKAFVTAMAGFKSEPTRILKSKAVNIPGGAKFNHATLADVVDGVIANLSKHGLSHRWDVEQAADAITVTCVITHHLGHSERAMLVAPPDAGTGRNKIQAIGSTITYLQRYTLMSACGLAAKDMDNDGKAAGKQEQPPEPEGFDPWALSIEALSESGLKLLQETWEKSPMNFREYATRFEADWWARIKNKARKADKERQS